MKVLCIYNHAEYCRPLERSIEAFREFGVEFQTWRSCWPIEHGDEPATEAEAEADILEAIWHYSRGCVDAIVLGEPPVTDAIIGAAGDTPLILLERVDGAQLRASRQYLPCVAGVIKSYAFRDRTQYNREHDRAHIRLLHEAGYRPEGALHRDELPQPQLSDDDLAKIHVGYSGFGCYDTIGVALNMEVDFEAERPIDVFFAGMVNYLNPEGLPTEVDLHRKAALKVAEDWPGKSIASPGRQIPRLEYYDLIRQSKVVLSPWGWGEATYRDYEAMALGAVVLKPDSFYVEACPDIYNLGICLRCSADFSDVNAAIAGARRDWRAFRDMRLTARNAVKKAWQPRAIAERMSSLIKEIVA